MTPRNQTGQLIEIHRIPVSDVRRSNCPRCGTKVLTRAGTSFIAALEVGGGLVLPACRKCVADEDSTIADAAACLNQLAKCLPRLQWRHATRCIGAMQVLAQDAVDAASTEQVQKLTGGRAEVRRAVKALIARQSLGVNDITVWDTVGAADPWNVIESLANMVANRIKHETGDVESWMRSTFLELAADEDEE